MYRKVLLILLGIFTILNFLDISCLAAGQPPINCAGLPGCKSDSEMVTDGGRTDNIGLAFIGRAVTEFIQLIAVAAVFALIFSGVMYLVSMGDEEKVSNAKKWIIYSLVGVLLSVSAWGIINLLNNFRINF